jgi:hypothetical protein
MPVTVPTTDEFAALEARVTALEGAPTPIPPEPIPPEPEPPDPGTGQQAKCAVDLIEYFGVNTFSSMDEHNQWGSWPADYRPEQVIAALKFLTADTGYALPLREYHYKGREAHQRPWLSQICAAIPGTRSAICPGANAGTKDVPSMLSLATDPNCGIAWVEGLNEPNTDFGSGEVPVEQTKAIQDAVWGGGVSAEILGPSIVAGTPHPEGWITGYCGASLAAINAAMHLGNGHYYPPSCPGVPNTGYSASEYIAGIVKAYGHPSHLTEFHPTLYNHSGCKPDQPGWSGQRDAFYMLLTLFIAAKQDVMTWWYALFDYGKDYVCGLFPTNAQNPRPAAIAFQTLCRLCADPRGRPTFQPGRLDVTVSGLPAGADYDLYQTSDGTFVIPLWRAAPELGGAGSPVNIDLANEATISEWDIIGNTEIQSKRTNGIVSDLNASCRLIIIRP